jgi:hypothetical protein
MPFPLRTAAKLRPANPANIIAQVEDSGTDGTPWSVIAITVPE